MISSDKPARLLRHGCAICSSPRLFHPSFCLLRWQTYSGACLRKNTLHVFSGCHTLTFCASCTDRHFFCGWPHLQRRTLREFYKLYRNPAKQFLNIIAISGENVKRVKIRGGFLFILWNSEKTAKLRGFSGAFPQFLHTFTDLAAKKFYGNTWKLQIVQAAGAETNEFLSLFTGKYTQKIRSAPWQTGWKRV